MDVHFTSTPRIIILPEEINTVSDAYNVSELVAFDLIYTMKTRAFKAAEMYSITLHTIGGA